MSDSNQNTSDTGTEEYVADVVDSYLQQLSDGQDPDPEAHLREHTTIADELAECLEGLGAISQLREALRLDEQPDVALPRNVGDFQQLREIGRGGMGVVYESRQISLDRVVALKCLLTGRHDQAGRERFRIEAEAAARLRHPSIVPIYEVGEIEGEPFFTMELIDGPSLAERLQQGPLPVREAVQIIRQAAEAIHHAHQMGVLHRDLKPSNILLDAGQIPRITDFGLAKLQDSDMGITQTGQVMGTPRYMSPEQAAGEINRVGPQTDVYMLGTVLYEVLTGRPPFLGASTTETLRQVKEQEPVAPRNLNQQIPVELSTICLKCLEKNPDDRYESAIQLAADLQAFLEGAPIQARPDTWISRIHRAVHREPHPEVLQARRPVGLTKAAVSLLVCILITVLRRYDIAPLGLYAVLVAGGGILVIWGAARRTDPLVERQVTNVWRAFLLGCLVVAVLDVLIDQEPLYLSPVIAVLGGMALFVMANLLYGWFYFGAFACFLAAILMLYAGDYDLLILGVVLFLTLLVPSLKFHE